LLIFTLPAGQAFAQSSPLATADFQNLLYVPAPAPIPNTSVTQAPAVSFFSGNIGVPCISTTPNNGLFYLVQSSFGQPFAAALNACSLEAISDWPALAITRQGGEIVVGWPTGWGTYVLEEANSLGVEAWRGSLQLPHCQGERFAVTVVPGKANKFFRLRKIACGSQERP
jgi:hypothetical protein